MYRLGKTVAMVGVGVAAVLPSGNASANLAPTHMHGSELERLADNPARLRALGKEVMGSFEQRMKSGKVSVSYSPGTCVVMNEHNGAEPTGTEVAAVVVDPAILAVRDPKTGIYYVENAAWDGKRYITGQVDLIDQQAGTYKVITPLNDEYLVTGNSSNTEQVEVTFSKQQNIVITKDFGTPIMDEVAPATGSSSKAIGGEAITQAFCESGQVQQPPATVTQPTTVV